MNKTHCDPSSSVPGLSSSQENKLCILVKLFKLAWCRGLERGRQCTAACDTPKTVVGVHANIDIFPMINGTFLDQMQKLTSSGGKTMQNPKKKKKPE